MMNKKLVAVAMAAALALPLAACGGSSASTSSSSGSAAAASSTSGSSSSSEKDASYYAGTWRGSVATTGTSVYGTTGGSEQMLDVILNEDGTCETKPCKNHEDLLTDTGTWELDGTTVKISFSSGKSATMTIENDNAMTADPTEFGIDGFDSIDFALY
mgnify:CR=1 FL=1